jgi:archaellum component FlaF (FlaF/FlaG flagellin family)
MREGEPSLGYGTVIAGIYFVAILLFSCYVYADSMNRISTISWKSLQEASSINLNRLRSALSITSIVVANNRTRLYVNVTNDGTMKIDRADLGEMDVILTYTDENTNLKQTYWCYYDSLEPSRHRWALNSSFVNPYPSAVNPLDWDQSETLSLVVELPTGNQLKQDSVGYLRVVLPEGSSDGRSIFTGA